MRLRVHLVAVLYLLAITAVRMPEMAAQSSSADPEAFVSQNLWTATVGGYATYRIPGIVVARSGVVLAYTSARHGTSDWADIDIVLRRSEDGGKTWLPSRRIAGDGHGVTDNPVAIADYQTGSIHFLYQKNYERCYYMRSDDNGRTFTVPIDITPVFEQFRKEYDWHVIAPGVGHAVQLKNGRLLVPIWMSTGTPTSPTSRAHHPSAIATVYSDDHGRTWHRGEIVANSSEDLPDPSESMAVQLPDGSVYLSIRNESKRHRRAFALSPDGSSHWTAPAFDDSLYEPICAASIVRYASSPQDPDRRILFSNPDSEVMVSDPQHPMPRRQNLTLRMSEDGARTWPIHRTVDAGIAGYSDIAVDRKKNIYVLYEEGSIRGRDNINSHIVLARFNLSWLSNGPASDAR